MTFESGFGFTFGCVFALIVWNLIIGAIFGYEMVIFKPIKKENNG